MSIMFSNSFSLVFQPFIVLFAFLIESNEFQYLPKNIKEAVTEQSAGIPLVISNRFYSDIFNESCISTG